MQETVPDDPKKARKVRVLIVDGDVDDLLDMIRAAYRHHPWPRGG